MSGLFSPNIKVLNEPLYFRSKIRTTMRCFSASLSTARIFAGIQVIWCHFLRLTSVDLGSVFKASATTSLTLFNEPPPYSFRQVDLAFWYGKADIQL